MTTATATDTGIFTVRPLNEVPETVDELLRADNPAAVPGLFALLELTNPEAKLHPYVIYVDGNAVGLIAFEYEAISGDLAWTAKTYINAGPGSSEYLAEVAFAALAAATWEGEEFVLYAPRHDARANELISSIWPLAIVTIAGDKVRYDPYRFADDFEFTDGTIRGILRSLIVELRNSIEG